MNTQNANFSGDINTLLQPIQNLVEGTFLDTTIFYIAVIVIITITVAYIVKFLFREIFSKIFEKTKTNLDDKIIEILEKPVFKTVIIIGMWAGAFIFLSQYAWWTYVTKIFISLILLTWFLSGLRVTKTILHYLAKKKSIHFIKKQTLPLFDNITFLLFFIVGFYIIAASIWDVDMTAFIAPLGVMGIAVGFAAKDTIANLFAGVFILADQPYKIGDYVVLDSGERGRVRHIGIRSTRILTRSDVEITIPNSIMGNTKITNESGGPEKKTRVAVEVGVAYGSDVEQVEKIILDAVKNIDTIETDPEPQARFRLLGASSLDLQVRYWVSDPSQKGSSIHAVNTVVYNALNKAGIEIPYQKQDLYIKEFPKN